MKRKMFLGIAALAVAVVSGYNVYLSKPSTKGLSDLALANVEALANRAELPEVVVECALPSKKYGKCRKLKMFYGFIQYAECVKTYDPNDLCEASTEIEANRYL